MLIKGGRFATMWMAWLPNEDKVSKMSEELVLKYNPNWKGAGYTRMKPDETEWQKYGLDVENSVSYDEVIPFDIDSWTGRIRACRGIGASLSKDMVEMFDREHRELLLDHFSNEFTVLHHIIITTFKFD
jgi:hypothetical protein